MKSIPRSAACGCPEPLDTGHVTFFVNVPPPKTICASRFVYVADESFGKSDTVIAVEDHGLWEWADAIYPLASYLATATPMVSQNKGSRFQRRIWPGLFFALIHAQHSLKAEVFCPSFSEPPPCQLASILLDLIEFLQLYFDVVILSSGPGDRSFNSSQQFGLRHFCRLPFLVFMRAVMLDFFAIVLYLGQAERRGRSFEEMAETRELVQIFVLPSSQRIISHVTEQGIGTGVTCEYGNKNLVNFGKRCISVKSSHRYQTPATSRKCIGNSQSLFHLFKGVLGLFEETRHDAFRKFSVIPVIVHLENLFKCHLIDGVGI